MRCPFCRHPSTSVVDSRAPKPGFVIRRRRQCPACGKRFTTFERVAIAMPWIIKRGGGRVEYNRAKLRGSMQLALRKRPVSSERIDAAVGAIEHKLSAMGEREVRSSKLGELVLEALRGMDTIAWIRFASVYLNINDPKAFAEMIEQALREAPAAADEDAAGLETGEFYGVPETDESVGVADSPIELSDDSDPKGQLASSDPDGYIRKYR